MTSKIDPSADNDPFAWLEEVDSPQARAWVEARNAETKAALCDAQFERARTTLLDILNAPDRIPWIVQRRRYFDSFWQYARNRKGVWRRTTLAGYGATATDWEIILDMDALVKAEGEDWVWRGYAARPPAHGHGLVQLSRGGA